MPETMKLLGSTKSKINKRKSSESVCQLEITELILVYFILAKKNKKFD